MLIRACAGAGAFVWLVVGWWLRGVDRADRVSAVEACRVTRLVRQGHDLVLVAELLGHARLETTRAYSLPTDADRQAAINSRLTDH